MISLKNLNKYYNKGRPNQIHVINDTSIDFPKTGLVALTGPSGCGKTTLLNVIGGLDSFYSGEITFNNQTIKKYNPMQWDMLRNEKVGYIFQNYNLVLSKTVYENIELALNMAGLYKKEEVEERVNYVLESVGMYNYRKRNVKALSGGQQQRVAIARALAKDPDVVLADEPTGNLDANNTFEIMSIIKKISETRLVILVTHERGLVDFYADRIIEISDGKVINDYENTGVAGFDHVDERNIYLKDLKLDESLKESGIDYYYDHEKDESLNVKLIEFKGSLYVKVKSKRKIKFIDETSEIRLVDDHYKKREATDISEYDFDLSQFKKIDSLKEKKSFIRWSTTIKAGFNRVFSRKKFVSKLFLLGYFIISAILVFQLATFGNITAIDEKDFVTSPRELMSVQPNKYDIQYEEINEILTTVEGIELSPYTTVPRMTFEYFDYYQGRARADISAYPVKLSYYQDVTLSYGELPDTNYEIAIDEWVAESILETKSLLDLNITNIEDLIGAQIRQEQNYEFNTLGFTIVGIVKTESPIVIVVDEAIFAFYHDWNMEPMATYGLLEGRIEIVEGRVIQNSHEMLVDQYSPYLIGEVVPFYSAFYNEMTVVGKYAPADNEYAYEGSMFVVSNTDLEEAILHNFYNGYYYDFLLFYTDNPEQAIEDFDDLGYELYNAYEQQLSIHRETILKMNADKIYQVVVIIIGIIVYIFFMMRSSMLNRIKEIGVYRAIGATKRDIYKIFFSEIITFTTVGSLTSYLLMTYVVNELQNQISDYANIFYFPIQLFLAGIIGIYLLNIVFGMLPIFTLLRKTPAEITAKFDI
ncbi:MAG: ATP-binding cassette domain-containing protein [Candidatus Izemoplasmatales bacterium]